MLGVSIQLTALLVEDTAFTVNEDPCHTVYLPDEPEWINALAKFPEKFTAIDGVIDVLTLPETYALFCTMSLSLKLANSGEHQADVLLTLHRLFSGHSLENVGMT